MKCYHSRSLAFVKIGSECSESALFKIPDCSIRMTTSLARKAKTNKNPSPIAQKVNDFTRLNGYTNIIADHSNIKKHMCWIFGNIKQSCFPPKKRMKRKRTCPGATLFPYVNLVIPISDLVNLILEYLRVPDFDLQFQAKHIDVSLRNLYVAKDETAFGCSDNAICVLALDSSLPWSDQRWTHAPFPEYCGIVYCEPNVFVFDFWTRHLKVYNGSTGEFVTSKPIHNKEPRALTIFGNQIYVLARSDLIVLPPFQTEFLTWNNVDMCVITCLRDVDCFAVNEKFIALGFPKQILLYPFNPKK